MRELFLSACPLFIFVIFVIFLIFLILQLPSASEAMHIFASHAYSPIAHATDAGVPATGVVPTVSAAAHALNGLAFLKTIPAMCGRKIGAFITEYIPFDRTPQCAFIAPNSATEFALQGIQVASSPLFTFPAFYYIVVCNELRQLIQPLGIILGSVLISVGPIDILTAMTFQSSLTVGVAKSFPEI